MDHFVRTVVEGGQGPFRVQTDRQKLFVNRADSVIWNFTWDLLCQVPSDAQLRLVFHNPALFQGQHAVSIRVPGSQGSAHHKLQVSPVAPSGEYKYDVHLYFAAQTRAEEDPYIYVR